MKRAAKQNTKNSKAAAKETKVKETKTTKGKQTKENKRILDQSFDEASILGENSYKRQQKASFLSSAYKNDIKSSFQNSTKDKKDTKFNTSVAKPLAQTGKSQSKKQITDISTILIQNENKDLTNIEMKDMTSPIRNKEQKSESKSPFGRKEASPFAQKVENGLLSSPKNDLEKGSQMVLRSGFSAACSKQGSAGSQKYNYASAEDTHRSKKLGDQKEKEENFGQQSPSNQIVTFNVNENLLNQDKSINKQNQKSQIKITVDTFQAFPARDRSPSDNIVSFGLEDYQTKLNRLNAALNSVSSNQDQLSLILSPENKSDESSSNINEFKQEEQKPIHHSFSTAQDSPQSREPSSAQNKIFTLLRNIMLEGQVLWEVQWTDEKAGTSFESEYELLDNYKQEFLKLRQQYSFAKTSEF